MGMGMSMGMGMGIPERWLKCDARFVVVVLLAKV